MKPLPGKSGASRTPFPRPNLTMRELIGLVLTFAISNAFLSWMNRAAASDPFAFGLWNGVLTIYLGFAWFQAWWRSVYRWSRTGDPEPRGRRRRWTALGVAEATVIGGTMFGCVMIPLERARGSLMGNDDWVVPVAILAIGSVASFLVLRMWREEPAGSLTGRAAGPTMETGPGIERGEIK